MGKTGQAWSARQSPLPHPVNREGQARDSNSGVYLTRYGPSFQNAKPLITKVILRGCSPTKSSKISLEMSYSAGNISGPSIFLFIALSQKTHYEKPRFQIAHCGIKIGNCICEMCIKEQVSGKNVPTMAEAIISKSRRTWSQEHHIGVLNRSLILHPSVWDCARTCYRRATQGCSIWRPNSG